MLPLVDLQRAFVHAVLAGIVPEAAIAPGRVTAAAALQVHRNTVIGALVNALRLTYPSVDALVGEVFFDQVAMAFAERHQPFAAQLAGYGGGFADFLATDVPSLPYLPDMARLDRAVDRALSSPAATRQYVLDGSVTLEWPVSLVVLQQSYPADTIKAVLHDDVALAAIDMTPVPRWLLAWRSNRHVLTRAITAPAAAFVEAMLAQRGSGEALAAAVALSADAPAIIQCEIFAASFCNVISGEAS